jgi:hypothetical protein
VKFDDMPMVRDEDDARRVHHETAKYFLSKNNKAHAQMTCHGAAEDWRTMIQNPRWRVASDVECRRLQASWCTNCS